MKLSLVSILMAASLVSVANYSLAADTTVSSTAQDIKTKFYELLGKDTATVEFKSGSSVLSESERKNLLAVVTAVRKDASISSVTVAAWSDKEYPEAKGVSLSNSQRKLADARNTAVKEYLISLGVKGVETYTMAEQPSWIEKLLNTKEVKVKGEGTIKDANGQLATDIGKELRERGGPGKAVIVIRRSGTPVAT